ncbi:MAG: DUF5050 domain-containing protein, partial [Eubacterium sp.]|nr:DUF5050 domain-containing protein [Eubacterium sp.]
MKNENYFDNPNSDEIRVERAKKKKKGSVGKTILLFIGMVAVALAAFIITIKVISPDFDLMSLVPKKVLSVVSVTSEPETVSTTVTTTVTTTEKPAAEPLGYLPIEEFKTDDSKKGNQLGNILNGGLVGSDLTYIYHIVNGDGIYRFNPSTEGYTRIYKTADRLSSLNLRGDYLYYVNNRDKKLYRLQKTSQKAEPLAEKVRHAYVYDNRVFYVTTDNRLCVMNFDKLREKTLYNSVDEKMTLTGVSLKRVFFTLDGISDIKFMSVDIKGKEKAREFRASAPLDEIKSPVLVNGFLYFYELCEDGSYALIRQKYGSENTVTL